MKKIILSLALLLAISPITASAYTVKPGDTLWKIAKANNTTWQQIAEDNNIENPNLIFAGQELFVGQLGAVTPQPRLLGDNTWTGTNTFSGTTTFSGNSLVGFGTDGLFGDGSDGDLTVTSTTVLSSDKYYNNLTINSGATLYPNGYRIYVKGTLTNNGIISADAISNGGNGGNGSGVTGGTAGATGTSATSTGLTIALGKAGSAGGAGCSSGGGGCNTAPKPANGDNIVLCVGGQGAVGGTGGGTPTAGTCTAPIFKPKLPVFANSFTDFSSSTKYNWASGNTGGYGGNGVNSQSSSNVGGAGGGGGGGGGNAGVIFINSNVYAGNGTTTAIGKNGGNGGNGANEATCTLGTSGAGNGGGGGAGGNGGYIFIGYRSKTFTGTSVATGGTGGTGGSGGTNACGNGTAGGNGNSGTAGTTTYYQF